MTDRQPVLNLSSDLRRIAWWACDKKYDRSKLIEQFLTLIKKEVEKLGNKKAKKIVIQPFLGDWPLVKQGVKDKLNWAEEILTASLRLKHLAEQG